MRHTPLEHAPGSSAVTRSTSGSSSPTKSKSIAFALILGVSLLLLSGRASAQSPGPVSDNFDAPALSTGIWTFVNPLGDGILTMNGTAATLNVPSGQAHDLWTAGNNTVRIVQPVQAGDFSIEVRFQSAVQLGNQDEGIVVEQDAANFVRFDIYSDGTNVNLFAAGISGSVATPFINSPIFAPTAPIWLRLQKTGNNWTGSWSTDGSTFTPGVSFTYGLNPTQVGPYAGNANSALGLPAFTAIVDYFFNTANQLPNQTGPAPYTMVTVDPNPPSTLVEKTLANVQGVAGHLNPVVGYEFPYGGIYWYEYPASGDPSGSWIRHTIIDNGNAYEDMTPYDVNGDGAVDIIASYEPPGSRTSSVVWFENPLGLHGNPATDTWVMHTCGPGLGEDNLVLADIDGDGKMDIATAAFVYFQNGPDSWTPVQYNSAFRGVSLFDIGSGLGSVNLVGIGPSPSYDVVWFENPREHGGNPRTDPWTMHTIIPGRPCANCETDAADIYAFAAADLNGDGRMDVVSGDAEGASGDGLVWYEAPADRRSGAWIPHTIDSSFVFSHSVQIADMDQNGTLDLVTAEQDQAPLRRVAIFYNDGKANFTESVLSNVEGHNMAIGDVNGNGDIDILNSGHGYYGAFHPLVIFLNRLKSSLAGGLTISSNVPGAQFSISGDGCSAGNYAAPATVGWSMGASCTVSLSNPNGFAFNNWSDGSRANPRTLLSWGGSATLVVSFNEPPAAGCAYTLSGSAQAFTPQFNSGQVNVTATPGCNWSATSSAPGWLSITSGGLGSGNGSIAFLVGENAGVSRTGTLTIAGRTFTVTQAGQQPGSSQQMFPAVWRQSSGIWYGLTPAGQQSRQWGLNGDVPVPADYDSDGKIDYAVWRPSDGNWFIIPSRTPGAPIVQEWGLTGDIPVPADYDGDGKADYAVWRPSNGNWYVIFSSNPGAPIVQQWGLPGDVPVPADYDGDGKADYAVWRPSNGTWYVIFSSNPGAPVVRQWGLNGDTPVPGDYDGDGKADYAVWRPANGYWYVVPSSHPGIRIAQQWGLNGDVPVPGDYDGDGEADLAVWRPSTGTWFVLPEGDSASPLVEQWGLSGDVPLSKSPL